MASGAQAGSGAIGLEQLIALNDEMAALVRAGIPLERGLAALGGQLPGKPGKLAELLASRMSQGESLQQILAAEDHRFPPVWRAVVGAGLRSGNLASALESLSETARRVADLRRLVAAGLVYPLIVVVVAYLVFLFLILVPAPLALRAHIDFTGASDPLLLGLTWLGRTAMFWAIPLPVVVAVLVGAWWRRSAHAVWSRQEGRKRPRSERWFGRTASIRQTLRNGRMATFAEIMALLANQRVPLDQALVLAAEASGDRRLAGASRETAERLQRGESLAHRDDLPAAFPPLLGWLLMTAAHQRDLSGALMRTAAVYRQRAARSAAWTAIYLPISVTLAVGGTATLACGLVAFLPFARMLYHLTWPIG